MGIDVRSIDATYNLVEREAHPQWWAEHDRIIGMLGQGMLISLVGKFGAGKTVIAACLIQQLIRCGGFRTGLYTTAPRFFRTLHDARNDGLSERGALRPFWEAELLIIDEAHERANTDFEDRRLQEIIDVRYGRRMDTLLISNLGPNEFAASIGDGAVDRLAHAGGIITCNWPSFRNAANPPTINRSQQ